jgi:hypothetical protein
MSTITGTRAAFRISSTSRRIRSRSCRTANRGVVLNCCQQADAPIEPFRSISFLGKRLRSIRLLGQISQDTCFGAEHAIGNPQFVDNKLLNIISLVALRVSVVLRPSGH